MSWRATTRALIYIGVVEVAGSMACRDLSGSPPLNATLGAATCLDFRGRCDDARLSAADKSRLMLHCPQTCLGTVYSDGGGHAYCACTPGRDCCFDEPPDCATRNTTTVVSQVIHGYGCPAEGVRGQGAEVRPGWGRESIRRRGGCNARWLRCWRLP